MSGSVSERLLGDPHWRAVDDLIEVLRQPVADTAVIEGPLGESLGDACHHVIALGCPAPVPQGNETQDAALHRPRPVIGYELGLESPVIAVVAFPCRRNAEVGAQAQRLSIPDETTADSLAVATRYPRSHESEPGAEVRRQPPVVPRGLPVARAPAVIAEPEAVDVPCLFAHLDRAGRLHQLLVVAPGELLSGPFGRLIGLTAEHGRASAVGQLHGAFDMRVGCEGGRHGPG